MPNPAVFLDRDGTLNKCDNYYVLHPGEVELYPDVAALGELHCWMFIVTNQHCVGDRMLITPFQAKAINLRVQSELALRGVEIEYVYTSYWSNRGFAKPSPWAIENAESTYDIDLSRSWIIGDKETDMQAGRAAGIPETNRILLIRYPQVSIGQRVDWVVQNNLWQAVEWIDNRGGVNNG